MTTYPLATLAVTVDETGISAPTYEDILGSLKASYQSVYGSDVYLEADSQDGQLVAIFAKAINDVNQQAIAVYNQFSPSTAVGAGLASVSKINGLKRATSSNSTALVTVSGQAGTVISNGIIGDDLGLNTKWSLPASVTIPVSGTIDVTATCATTGAVTAAANSLTQILTPTRGWSSVTNAAAATVGNPVESDAALRRRQAASTAASAQTVTDGIYGAIANLAGVSRLKIYDNDGEAADANGIPAHSISVVVAGGDAQTIAQTIATKKGPGTGTYGTTSETVVDSRGAPSTINFFQLATETIYVNVGIKALLGYVSTTGDAIAAAIATYISSLDIGETVYYGRLWAAANLSGDAATTSSGQSQAALDALRDTYNITSITLGTAPNPVAITDIAIVFNEAAACAAADVTVTVS